MSREVRRVPIDWSHPVEVDPYWNTQRAWRINADKPESKLIKPGYRFVGLVDDYPGAVATWEEDVRLMKAREGRRWDFDVKYHLTGYQSRDDTEPVVRPFYGWTEDGMHEIETVVRDEDHLHELAMEKVEGEKPDPTKYMPVFTDEQLGWVLYETVSEGTPVTPVFETAAELITHLATVGQDWDQIPMRHAAAEALVSQGGSLGSMLMSGGVLYDSATDADKIAALLPPSKGDGPFLTELGAI